MIGKIVFITGATGKLGRHLIKRVIAKDRRILLLSRKKACELSGSDVSFIEGDILDPGSYARCMKGVDTVLHMAAVTHTNDIKMYYRTNADATRELVKLSRANGVKRFVYVSTRAASFDGGHYSRSKLMAEKHVRESGLDWVILRLSEVYGFHNKEGVDMIFSTIQRFPLIPIIGNGEYTLAPVHFSDAVDAIKSVLENGDIKNKIYNIAGPESFTYEQFIDRVMAMKGLKRIKLHIPVYIFDKILRLSALFFKNGSFSVDQLPRLLCEKCDDISLAKRDLDFKPIGLGGRAKGAIIDV